MYVDPTHGQLEWRENKIGNLEPSYTAYKITCKKECRLNRIKVLFNKKGAIKLYGSILKNESSVYTHFCKGETGNKGKQICDMNKGEITYKDYRRKEVYITLEVLKKSSDVTLRVRMDGFEKAEKIPSNGPHGPVNNQKFVVGTLPQRWTDIDITCKGICKRPTIKATFDKGRMNIFGGTPRTNHVLKYYLICQNDRSAQVKDPKEVECDLNLGKYKYEDHPSNKIELSLQPLEKSYNVNLVFDVGIVESVKIRPI